MSKCIICGGEDGNDCRCAGLTQKEVDSLLCAVSDVDTRKKMRIETVDMGKCVGCQVLWRESDRLRSRLTALEQAAQAVVEMYDGEGEHGTPFQVQMLAKALKGENK